MLKETIRKLAIKLVGIYFLGAIIAALLILTMGGLAKSALAITLMSAACILFYLAMVYNTTWDEGFKDPNRVRYGHMPKTMTKGLVAGLFADIPCFAAYLFVLISMPIGGLCSNIAMLVFKFFNMSFLYPIAALESAHLKLLLILFCLPLPLISFGAYVLGYRRISLLHKVVYKKQPADGKDGHKNKW